jgi:energy-converting hydrogenase Eha subunit B
VLSLIVLVATLPCTLTASTTVAILWRYRDNKYDFVEVVHDALSTAVGRALCLALSIVAGFLGAFAFMAEPDLDILGFEFKYFSEGWVAAIFTPQGVVVMFLLGLFGAGFLRFQWPFWTLLISFSAPWLVAGGMY